MNMEHKKFMEIGSIADGFRYKNSVDTVSVIDGLKQKKFMEIC